MYIVLNDFINKRFYSNNLRRVTIVYLMMLVLIGHLIAKIQYTTNYGKPVSVALLQGNIQKDAKWDSASVNNTLKVYANLINNTRANIIFVPETGIAQYEEYLPVNYLNDLTALVKSVNSELIIGMPKIINKQNDYVNAAIVITNPKHPYYAKRHLVPFGEYIPLKFLLKPLYDIVSLPMVGFSQGAKEQLPIVVANQKIAFNICYENGFNTELIEAARNSTLMVNLSDMVWYGTTIAQDEHLQLSQARALENQRYFVQVTNTGKTAIINPQGQIQAKLPSFTRATLKDYVQGRTGITPFEMLGNYPIIIFCCLIFGFTLFLLKKTIASPTIYNKFQ